MSFPSNKEYQALVKQSSPSSPLVKDMLFAFLIGGAICAIGQVARSLLSNLDLSADDVGTLVSAIMIFLGVLLTSLGVYDMIAKYGGAGTLVPITGFANAVSSPAIEFHSEGIVTGICAKMFTIAGPVIVFATLSGTIYGIIYWLRSVL